MKRQNLVKLSSHLLLFVSLIFFSLNYKVCIYLMHQAKGQFTLLFNRESLSDFEKKHPLSTEQKNNLSLIPLIKQYSVDSLSFSPTQNFNSIYDQKGQPLLWLITASEPFELKPYYWRFPLVGKVSYKGFFKKELAIKEQTELLEKDYDVELREVSAYSTLGWLSDPVLSNLLNRSKGSLCHLIFHELVHATYYAPGAVDFNENIAEFVAHKATLQFLKHDSLAFKNYIQDQADSKIFNAYMLQKMEFLSAYYAQIKHLPNRSLLKNQLLKNIADSITFLPINNKTRYVTQKKEIQKFKNAYFIGFIQYNSLQDSLEAVFNKIYKGKIEKLVQDLKLN